MKKKPRASWSTSGRYLKSTAGAWMSARIGEVLRNLPRTSARTEIQNTSTHSRQSRNLVQFDSLRWLTRSIPPKKETVQNRWYRAECSLIR